MSSKQSVLVIDDEEVMQDALGKVLQRAGYRPVSARTGREGLELLVAEGCVIDAILLDLMLPGEDGLTVLKEILVQDPYAVVVVVTAFATYQAAVEATKLGAFGFIGKPFKHDELLLSLKNGMAKRNLELENRQLKELLKQRTSFREIIGKSRQMKQIFELIAQVGPSRSTVLVVGESGTGKELVAKAIHQCSPRSGGPFVAVNTGSIPTELLESELFGHVKGAFTGAIATKKGLFEVADQGTLFLDEVGTIPLDTQAKLLRVIQEREFRRVGGLETIGVDVRIIAATNLDLKKAVEERRFRDDLYYRLNVINLTLPPLRERKEDIPLLADHFVRKFSLENGKPACSIKQDALRMLMEYEWPGNVRELENVVERCVVLAPSNGHIGAGLLPHELLNSGSVSLGRISGLQNGVSLRNLVLEYERGLILTALRKTDGNQKKAADLLKVNATTLNEKLKRLKITIPV